jgi:fructosamine-3-kinase
MRKVNHLNQLQNIFKTIMKCFNKEAPGQARAEVDVLCALQAFVRVPEIYFYDDNRISMEYIPTIQASAVSDLRLAEALVTLHKKTNTKFGWHSDNFIGLSKQPNTWCTSWSDFFVRIRLDYQMSLAKEYSQLVDIWKEARANIIRELELVSDPPSLTHGDLWSGNLLVDINENPVFIDPAVSYSHRETDLAMMKLFGGFSERVFHHYTQLWPLQPGHEKRQDIYQLYHLLNHLNLFGPSYLSQATRLMAKFVDLN